MSDHIVLFLQSMGEREMADEVTRMHNRLEAFASGLDRDAFDGMARAGRMALDQRDGLLATIKNAAYTLQGFSTEEWSHDLLCELQKSIAKVQP